MQLKMHGPLTAADLGKRLGTTGEAARQQLMRLGESGLVVATSQRSGVGRPRQEWSLTEAGQTRFPDTHATLTVELLDSIRSELGEQALNTVIAARERRTGNVYAAAMAGCRSLNEKVEVLSELRSAEGYMADWSEQEDGTVRFVEHHCPICAAATACQGFCRSEMAIFRMLLGPSVEIRRDEHIVNGGRRCTYVLSETQ
ncbi:metalloregulator ArsR/SmtB family transcription factor [Martelella mangrovi]|uniref:ArsR family transcriptional regulator n=1 Tax=Martelella mangrovi TaxID=1397477 RepID=A0ABV2ICJ0_9HYPH|nr:metalloregulator ArsR/SmtB family transcription factor [uncultured Martelella sp.]